MILFGMAVSVVQIPSVVFGGEVSFVYDGNMIPDPNTEITVYVYSDDPLFAMGAAIAITGDANITTAMCEADCNNYGWDNGWNSDPYIDDANGLLYLNGISWASDANGTVGYFKFIYHSGEVSVSFLTGDEWSIAFIWDGNSCPEVPFSENALLFGEPEQNQSLFYENSFEENQQFLNETSYSDQTILITDDEFVVYDGNLVLDNCIMDVNGSVECNSDITLINSVIRVKGYFKVMPGVTITETGQSSIIPTGDAQKSGKIVIEGRPDNPIIVESDYIQNDAEFIIFDSDSSSNSILKWVDFYGGWCNIQISNKRLNESISNCCFFGADYAIYQDCQNDLTDVRFSLFYDNYTSIYVGIDGTYGEDIELLIDNVVIDNQNGDYSCGLVLDGLQSTSDFSSLKLTNLILTNSWCGWYINSESFYPPVMSNIAYYGNSYDDNLYDSSFQQNPMYLTQSPFETPQNSGDWPYFIDPQSPVADVNLGYDLWQNSPQQLVTSLFVDSAPRSDKGMGFGLPILPEYSSRTHAMKADFDDDGIVNFSDYSKFAAEWGTVKDSTTNPVNFPDANGYSIADFDKDGTVDVLDLADFTSKWLSEDKIELTMEDGQDSLSITCQQVDGLNIGDYAFFLDGKYIATRDSDNNPDLIINKIKYPKGTHNLRAVIKGEDGRPYVTVNRPVSFNSSLNSFECQEIFDPCNFYFIKGKVDEGNTATIQIKDLDGDVLWSNEYTSDFTAAVDPCNFLSGTVNYEIAYTCESMSLSPTSSGIVSVSALDGEPSYKTAGLIICMFSYGMTEGTGNYTDTGTCRFAAKMMKERGVTPIILRGYDEYNEVCYTMFDKVFKKYRNIRYMHIYSHGSDECTGAGILGIDVYRTTLQFNDGLWPTYNSRIWTTRNSPVPEDYEWLAEKFEKANTLDLFPFKDDQLRILVTESCYALRNPATRASNWVIDYKPDEYDYEWDHKLNFSFNYFYSDICFAFNMLGDKQMALGSGEPVVKSPIYLYWTRFFNGFWYELGSSGSNSASDAVDFARAITTEDIKRRYRIRGLGTGNMSQIYLNTNP